MNELAVPTRLVEATLRELREGGESCCERLVLWLGRRRAGGFAVTVALVPPQDTGADFFRVPAEGMAAVFDELRRERSMIVAQVHSHPGQAFHSDADDEWALIRHEGAYSIVVPRFARGVSVRSFLREAAVFRLSAQNEWVELTEPEVIGALEIVDEP